MRCSRRLPSQHTRPVGRRAFSPASTSKRLWMAAVAPGVPAWVETYAAERLVASGVGNPTPWDALQITIGGVHDLVSQGKTF